MRIKLSQRYTLAITVKTPQDSRHAHRIKPSNSQAHELGRDVQVIKPGRQMMLQMLVAVVASSIHPHLGCRLQPYNSTCECIPPLPSTGNILEARHMPHTILAKPALYQ